ncbi:UMP-CMP kinase [Spiromyces aspiralis]|uniref:UMP-CMP kinase n=1 Tax=Spiromyces aspiralis TaxID=68401 RepID=A0ACC1HRU1_9FUNG|nr:UMP-CMP kinase [Spiromyces aspiralis]
MLVSQSNQGYQNKTFGPTFIGVAGGRGAGKKELCELIVSKLNEKRLNEVTTLVLMIELDDFHRELTDYERELAAKGHALNLDHPDAFDFKLLEEVMVKVCQGAEVTLPRWDPRTMTRTQGDVISARPQVVLVEGILTLYNRNIRRFFDMQIFIEVDADTRLGRNLKTFVEKNQQADGQDASPEALNTYLKNYLLLEKPVFEEFILPSKRWADIIIPRGDENRVAMNLIMHHINDMVISNRNTAAPSEAASKRSSVYTLTPDQ